MKNEDKLNEATNLNEAIDLGESIIAELDPDLITKPNIVVAEPVEVVDTIKDYKGIYDNLCKTCNAAAKKVPKVAPKVSAIIAYLDKNKDDLNDLKTAVNVLTSTNKLLAGEMKPEAYKQEALNFKQTGHTILGALMMALGSIMLAAGIGLSATGVATGVGIGLVLSGGGLAGTGYRFFKAGHELDDKMIEIADLSKPVELPTKDKGLLPTDLIYGYEMYDM